MGFLKWLLFGIALSSANSTKLSKVLDHVAMADGIVQFRLENIVTISTIPFIIQSHITSTFTSLNRTLTLVWFRETICNSLLSAVRDSAQSQILFDPKYFLFCHCYVYINVVLYFVTNLFIFIFTLCFISKKDSALLLDEKCCLKTFSKESYLLCY